MLVSKPGPLPSALAASRRGSQLLLRRPRPSPSPPQHRLHLVIASLCGRAPAAAAKVAEEEAAAKAAEEAKAAEAAAAEAPAEATEEPAADDAGEEKTE